MTVLYRGGRVRTPAHRDATALLVDDGVVAWVGSDAAADALAADEVVDLDGAWVAPAFVDAHVHATSTGLALTGVDLSAATSLAQALDLVMAAAAARPGQVLLGTGWDDTRWPERRPPTAAELDRAAGGAPVYLSRTDVHSAACSSALLARVPHAQGLPGWDGDGVVRQDAHNAVRMSAYEAVTPAQRADAQEATLRRAAELGIAAVHECGGPMINGEDDFTALLDLGRRPDLPDVVGLWGEAGGIERARALGARSCGGDLLLDGSVGSRTACLREPYADAGHTGACYLGRDELVEHLVLCARAGFPTGFHAIGDGALDQLLLDCLPAAEAEVGTAALRTLRNRVEHAELLHPEHVEAMARYGMVASVQPAFDAYWGGDDGMYVERLGADRARRMNPYAALAAAGVALALSSDAPVTPLDPWGAVRAAVRHRTPGSGLSARAAFAAHTRGGWRAVHDDASGDLVPGAPATFAVWQVEGDLLVQAPDERVAGWSTDPRSGVSGLPDLDSPDPLCLRTVVRGLPVYARA